MDNTELPRAERLAAAARLTVIALDSRDQGAISDLNDNFAKICQPRFKSNDEWKQAWNDARSLIINTLKKLSVHSPLESLLQYVSDAKEIDFFKRTVDPVPVFGIFNSALKIVDTESIKELKSLESDLSQHVAENASAEGLSP